MAVVSRRQHTAFPRSPRTEASACDAGDRITKLADYAAYPDLARAFGGKHGDRITKLADYAAFGVRFYWMLEPDRDAAPMIPLAC